MITLLCLEIWFLDVHTSISRIFDGKLLSELVAQWPTPSQVPRPSCGLHPAQYTLLCIGLWFYLLLRISSHVIIICFPGTILVTFTFAAGYCFSARINISHPSPSNKCRAQQNCLTDRCFLCQIFFSGAQLRNCKQSLVSISQIWNINCIVHSTQRRNCPLL